jgi:hypothetical protein
VATTASAAPGTPCLCGCNCAVPLNRSPRTCPCPCADCDVCGTRPASAKTVGPQRTPTYPFTQPPLSVETSPAGGTMAATSAPTFTEAQLAQLLAAVRPQLAETVPAAPAPTPEQTQVAESAELRAMSNEQLGREFMHRLAEARAVRSPGWTESRRRAVPALVEQAALQNTVEEAALAVLNDPKRLAETSTGELARQTAARMRHAHGLQSPAWK